VVKTYDRAFHPLEDVVSSRSWKSSELEDLLVQSAIHIFA
jgi:hypothetical protein